MDIQDINFDEAMAAHAKHPTWRWQKVQEYIHTQDVLFLEDVYIQEMTHMYSLFKDPMRHVKAQSVNYPHAFDALMLNIKAAGRGGPKWQVEAMIMAGATNDELQDRLPMPGGEDSYEMYRKIYFDVDEHLHNPNVMVATVVATAYPSNHLMSDCDLTWKMIAYTLGLEAFDNLISHFAGGMLNEDVQMYMYNWCKARALYYSYTQVNDIRLMYNEGLTNVLSMSRQHFKYSDEMARDQEEKRVSSCVKQLLGSVEYALFESERQLPPTEVVNNFSLSMVEKATEAV